MKRNAGFSLVELVIVIVVLGLLAVAALPRFLDVTDKAKEASVEGVAGGFATAVLSARAQWEANVRTQETSGNTRTNFVDYDGTEFWLTTADTANFRDGYPIALKEDGSQSPLAVSAQRCVALMEELLQNPPQVSSDSNDTTAKYLAEVAPANDDGLTTVCRYTQLEGNSAHYFDYDAANGSVVVQIN
ncbi:prepilin-type N-terminal cleavage/methylation domain-containing protein [Vibrio superstes]|uniref:MSHA pilin protein MshB n=1 Tax=Vibrio superstes NBRC 103154 TaxID=1219062 RepID=A0A511QVE9_9VIBR|nr:prepilin-type N-terminal cleavage/methylation domain-containing protein [Vibrio superstes]GEM80957.1 MSHA pilin protein MshB [Vibrio superstes NBRC 103154]